MEALAHEISDAHDRADKEDSIEFSQFLQNIEVTYQQWFDWYCGKHVARECTAKKIRAKLAKLRAPAFTSKKVTEDDGCSALSRDNLEATMDMINQELQREQKTGHLLDLIGDVMEKDSYTASYKIELIRFLISK